VPNYRRLPVEGGEYFLTIVTHERRPILRDATARRLLREAIREVRRLRPFEIVAIVLLPDHFHWLIALPPGDADFSGRVRAVKHAFTKAYLAAGGSEGAFSLSRVRHRQRGVWQKRFHDHVIRDDRDFVRHVEYIHYNPVKHGYAASPHGWPWSSLHRYVRMGWVEPEWQAPAHPDALGDNPEFE
jgi:putative transposase